MSAIVFFCLTRRTFSYDIPKTDWIVFPPDGYVPRNISKPGWEKYFQTGTGRRRYQESVYIYVEERPCQETCDLDPFGRNSYRQENLTHLVHEGKPATRFTCREQDMDEGVDASIRQDYFMVKYSGDRCIRIQSHTTPSVTGNEGVAAFEYMVRTLRPKKRETSDVPPTNADQSGRQKSLIQKAALQAPPIRVQDNNYTRAKRMVSSFVSHDESAMLKMKADWWDVPDDDQGNLRELLRELNEKAFRAFRNLKDSPKGSAGVRRAVK